MARTPDRQRGFTFIELLIVCALLVILVMLAMPMARHAHRRAKEQQLRRALQTVRSAIDEYRKYAWPTPQIEVEDCADCYGYPPDLETLVEGVKMMDGTGKTRKFLREIPRDPFNTFDEEWDEAGWKLRSFQDDWDASSWGRENVFDIHSASELQALDGTFYKDW